MIEPPPSPSNPIAYPTHPSRVHTHKHKQLVKLAVGCLNELAPVHDDHWVSGEEEEEGHAQVAGKLEGLNLGRSSGGTKDELGASAASARSMSSSMGSMASDHSRPPAPSSTPRQTSSGSDAGAGAGPAASGGPGAGGASMQRRPSFLLGLLGKKESSSSSALAAQAGEPGSGGSAGSRPAGISTAGSKGLSAFFSDPGKKAGSNVTATSPHGTGLSHSSFNQYVLFFWGGGVCENVPRDPPSSDHVPAISRR